MRWLTLYVPVLVTAALVGGCSSDSDGSSGGNAESASSPGDSSPDATATDGDSSALPTETDTPTEGDESSGTSTGGPDAAEPLQHEECQPVPVPDEQTPAAIAIAEALEAEIAALGRADDIALVDFGIRLGVGQGGGDVFCASMVLHSEWFASLHDICIQDTDQDVVLAELSSALASAPTLPAFATQDQVETAVTSCFGEAFVYTPCRGPGFLSTFFDPDVLGFSTGEDDGECTFSSTLVELAATTAETLSCESDVNDTCDTEG